MWENIDVGLNNLYSDSRYPGRPSTDVETFDKLEPARDFSTFYAQRLWAYLVAPETGRYTFYMSCNDECELWLSTSESPHFKSMLHSIKLLMGYDEWKT